MQKSKLIDRIKALLAKTTENGCTECEAFAALEKAQAMMCENGVSEMDVAPETVVLRECYKRHGLFAPWGYRNDMCYRTLKNLRPDIAFGPHGTAHNALDDAVAQARHAERIVAAMNNQG